jgi:TPR repeat protein
MNRMFIAAITALILAMGFTSAAAGPVDDAVVAANRGDNATALRLLRPLAERGDAAAQYCLGLMYANGKGVSRDYAAAVT